MSELKNIELETKYSVEGDIVYAFKKLVQNFDALQEFIYLESNDIYYTNDISDFVRYRYSANKLEPRAEITWKVKPAGATNNTKRIEVNWRVDGTPFESIEAGVNLKGYYRNFEISKYVHIYKFEDATIPFYTVFDDQGKADHFIEIEVDEELIKTLTEEQAWDIIRKYERLLAPLGINSNKRLKKSLFEIYKK